MFAPFSDGKPLGARDAPCARSLWASPRRASRRRRISARRARQPAPASCSGGWAAHGRDDVPSCHGCQIWNANIVTGFRRSYPRPPSNSGTAPRKSVPRALPRVSLSLSILFTLRSLVGVCFVLLHGPYFRLSLSHRARDGLVVFVPFCEEGCFRYVLQLQCKCSY